MQRFNIRLEGSTPLLFNRMTEEELEKLRTKDKKKFVAVPEPREVAQKKLYLTNDTQLPYLPADMLMACLINAGMFVKLDGKRQMSTSKSTLLPGFVTLEDHYMLIQTRDGQARWEVDMRQGRNPNTGDAICIIRPRFDNWAINFSMLIDTEQMEDSKIRDLVDIAGRRIGVGDFRPQRKGIYGQFRVGCWEAASA